MSDPGLIYFSHGTKHLTRLAVSLFSLRRHFDGPVAILDTGTPDAALAIRSLAACPLAGIERVVRIELVTAHRHACYVTKASLWRYSPFATTIFLDADTIVDGSPIPLGQAAEAAPSGLAITSFSDWTTETPIIRKRIEGWADLDSANVQMAFKRRFPAINTGVMAWSREPWERGRSVLPVWEELTQLGWRKFICDEIAMQLIVADPVFANEIAVLDGRWNHSPTYGLAGYGPGGNEKPIVWHFHGDRHVRKPEGDAVWSPVCEQARAANFGGLADWESSLA